MDPRIIKLADSLVNYSCAVKQGENVLIDYEGELTRPLVRQLVRQVYLAGAFPYVTSRDSSINREIMLACKTEQIEFLCQYKLEEMKGMDSYIAIRGSENAAELSDVPSDQTKLYMREMRPLLDYRVNHTKWVVLRYPNPSMAQLANTSQEAFENFYFDVCTIDYEKMGDAMDPLVELMNRTDKVLILGPGTDLSFSIKGIPTIKCCGERNIPDGEVYTAPVKDSVNGKISYNTPSEELGFTFDNIVFDFKDGKIINATANNNKKINDLLDTDEGARFIGEFAIGVNPFILEPMKDTLFDEKIAGSFHFTPGASYDDAFNGNKSAVHWDLVNIQRPEYGGGEIWFDDVLIRKDGLFVPEELHGLNPENLK
ncbi:MAG: aminopeptidase [Anaerovoracaceae bacterium]|jgi:aminopeptidase|nr:aminopeptidase [Anaerovoracaceae bacterium]